MTTIVVTGSTGLLGSELVPYLRNKGSEVIGISRHKNTDFNGCLTHYEQVRALLGRTRPDIIINLAALTNVDECEKHPNKAYLYNVKIVENIARWVETEKPSCRIIQISTDQVYDGSGVNIESEIELKNYYAFSKYAGELALDQKQHTILRTNFFGLSRCQGRLSFTDWLFESLRLRKFITVFEDVVFSPLSLQTLIKYIGVVIETHRTGVFNLGSKTPMSKAEFAFFFAGVLGFPDTMIARGTLKQAELSARRPSDMSMDSSKFEREFEVELPRLKDEIQLMREVY